MILILTTVDNERDARDIAKTLVEMKLSSCVSYFPIKSTYFWKNKIWEDEAEFLLIIKTLEEKAYEIIDWLKKNHPYDVPEIISINAEAHGKYVDWLVQYILGVK